MAHKDVTTKEGVSIRMGRNMWEPDTVVVTSPTLAPARTRVQNWNRAGVFFGLGVNNLPGNNEKPGMAYWLKLTPLFLLRCATPVHSRRTPPILALVFPSS